MTIHPRPFEVAALGFVATLVHPMMTTKERNKEEDIQIAVGDGRDGSVTKMATKPKAAN